MARRSSKSSAPVEKIMLASRMLQCAIENLLEHATDADFNQQMLSLRDRHKQEEEDTNKLNKAALEIMKTLRRYNEDFSRVFLTFLKQKISEYQALSILDQYKISSPRDSARPENAAESQADESLQSSKKEKASIPKASLERIIEPHIREVRDAEVATTR
jgi:hypothetical protein